MIPEVRLSSQPVVGKYLAGDDLPTTKLQDFEQGGAAIGDPTQGLQLQTWELRVLGEDVRVRPYPNGTYTLLFKRPGITNISFAWDQNMRPAVVFAAGGLYTLWWYDPVPTQQRQVFTNFHGIRDAVLCLDEKRPERRDFSDILMFYLKDPVDEPVQRLYMRAQRDRYGVEYNLGNLPVGTTALYKAGMSNRRRVQLGLYGRFVETGGPRRDIPPYPPEVPPGELILQFGQQFYPGNTGYVEPRFQFTFYTPPISYPLV